MGLKTNRDRPPVTADEDEGVVIMAVGEGVARILVGEDEEGMLGRLGGC